jgi:hypothetical protein
MGSLRAKTVGLTSRRRFPKPTITGVIAVTALAVAASGTAVAATGSLVNIADGTNAAQLAKVDATGALKTNTTGGVLAYPTQPLRPMLISRPLNNFYNNGGVYIEQFRTSATVAITHISFTNVLANDETWELGLFYSPVQGGVCDAENALGYRVLTLNLPPDTTADRVLPTPIVLKPNTPGATWCLTAIGGPSEAVDPPSDASSVVIDYYGFVVSGVFSVTPNTPATAHAPKSFQRKPAK